MEIYALRGGMLQHNKTDTCEKVLNLLFFKCGVRERGRSFATNEVLHIYPKDVRGFCLHIFRLVRKLQAWLDCGFVTRTKSIWLFSMRNAGKVSSDSQNRFV